MTTLPEKTSYKLIDSAKAGFANATTKDAYVVIYSQQYDQQRQAD